MKQDDRYRRAEGGAWLHQPRPHKPVYRPSLTVWMLLCVSVLCWIWVIAAVVT